ncbi:E3 ubiquitin-protein ligase RAD18 isoform X1 [Oryzias latipes]|uniref:RING-type E3 ubiquitin transferase n=1 Tax=Oryzias latipes TaxID=8090 RepID=A0A3B3I8Z2_ORYLA|nr:E3 ubiquitin-protein ligase RAD18 isoform X1 [Oryzias latipes]
MAHHIEADLPASLACLKNVDSLLRCPICFDYVNISMMTKCSHNFCSLCIRKFLSYKLQCPVCNTPMTEQDLRNNRILDELTVNFQVARQQLIKANFDSPPISPKTPASVAKCQTPREKGQKPTSSILSHFFQKKVKSPSGREAHQDIQSRELQTAQPGNSGNVQTGQLRTSVVIKEEPMDVEDSSTLTFGAVKHEDMASYSSRFHMTNPSPSKDVKPVIKVECPVCSVSVSQHFINKHLDSCLTRGEKKESLRSSLGKARRPMAKLVYNLLSMQELRRRLKECQLSVQGSRDQLVRRHQDFIHLFNAECDSLNPKSVEEIAKEVEANEKMRSQLQGKIKPVMVFSKNHSEEEIEAMHSNYRKQHSSDFSRLIAQVRGRLGSSRQRGDAPGGSERREAVQESHSSAEAAEPKNGVVVKVEAEEVGENTSAAGFELPSSPTLSDVSISSSISDIFGPESPRKFEDTEKSPVQKRRSSSRGDDGTPLTGKRRRKT